MRALHLDAERVAVEALNGAIVVARRLVGVIHGGEHSDKATEIAERARYCQLMCAKMKFSGVDASRTVLAAWLSGLTHKQEIIGSMVMAHGVAGILHPENDAEKDSMPQADVLNLIMCYQDYKKNHDASGDAPDMIQKYLQKEWAVTHDRSLMVNRFATVLRDEAFVAKSAEAVGRVLIIDHDESVSPVLSIPLESRGYKVDVAADVELAVQAMSRAMPDLIVCEMEMPFISGVEFCEQVKSTDGTSHIPFLIITSKKGKKVPAMCLRAGADDCIAKPVDLELLFLRIERVWKTNEREVADAEHEAGVTGSLDEMDFTDLIQILCAGGKSTEIVLSVDNKRGAVFIKDGEIVDASSGDLTGDMAFYDLMCWKKGVFSTHNCDRFAERTIESSTMSLLMEGARLADESEGGVQ
ncbi:MAG: response regulator [Kiritimatiellae bacterium]|nr:response regulator [Kiritimatiellia bacterium]